jgi:hypothetical protein
MRASPLLAAATALALSACSDFLDTSGNADTGIITVPTFSDGGGGYLLSPLGIFYAESDLTLNVGNPGACSVLPYDPAQLPTTGGFSTMNVGPFLLADFPARQDTLYLAQEGGLRFYRPGQAAGLLHTPGDTLVVTVPASANFPGTTILTRTAEPFDMDEVGVPALNNDLTVTWTAAPHPGSVMRYSLRYATENSPGGPDQQLICVFADDGEATIDAGFLQGWVTAVGSRQVLATRIRYRQAEVDERHRLALVSSFDRPLQTLPTTP